MSPRRSRQQASAVCVTPERRYRSIRNVLIVVLVLNVAVALAKLLYGTFSRSAAMQADGIHSLFDGTSNVVGLVGMRIAARPVDASHPYGHGKFEAFTAAFIAIMLGVAAYTVGREAIVHLLGRGEPTSVTAASFIVMSLTLAVNLFVSSWESRVGRRLGSEVLMADARHTLSDVLVSSGVIAGLIAIELGWEQADGVVALLVAFVIVHTAITVLRGVGRTLGDQARLAPDEVARVAAAIPGVLGCHSVRTRGSESQVFVDLHVVAAADVSLERGHEIAHAAEAAIRARFAQVADVMVHVEPPESVAADVTRRAGP